MCRDAPQGSTCMADPVECYLGLPENHNQLPLSCNIMTVRQLRAITSDVIIGLPDMPAGKPKIAGKFFMNMNACTRIPFCSYDCWLEWPSIG